MGSKFTFEAFYATAKLKYNLSLLAEVETELKSKVETFV